LSTFAIIILLLFTWAVSLDPPYRCGRCREAVRARLKVRCPSRYLGRAWVGNDPVTGKKLDIHEAQKQTVSLVLSVVGIYAIFLGLSGAQQKLRRPLSQR
jgi:hypothetical protein